MLLLSTTARKASQKRESIGVALDLRGPTVSLVPEPKIGVYTPAPVVTQHFLSQQKPPQSLGKAGHPQPDETVLNDAHSQLHPEVKSPPISACAIKSIVGPMDTNPVWEHCCFCPILERSRQHVTPQLKSHKPRKIDARKASARWAVGSFASCGRRQ